MAATLALRERVAATVAEGGDEIGEQHGSHGAGWRRQ